MAPNPTTLSIITSALRKLGVMGAAQSEPNGEDTQFALDEYNQLLGQFNVRDRKAYFERHQAFTFTASQNTYSIGTAANSADFQVTSGDRPVKIDRARLILTADSPDVYLQCAVFNWPQYTLLSVPQLTSQWPFSIYYEPQTPNGIIYPYPVPTTTSNQLELWWKNQLETVAIADITTALTLPPGLERALALRLAESLWLSFPKRTDLEELKRQTRIAVSDFESQNQPPPFISTTDGVQSKDSSSFDWRSRQWM